MNTPVFSLANHAQAVINTTVAQAALNYASGVGQIQGVVPTSNKWGVVGANGQASTSVFAVGYGVVQGNQSNPVARVGDQIPAAMLQLQNLVASQTTVTNRI